jgi:biopolymer transport protein ExbB
MGFEPFSTNTKKEASSMKQLLKITLIAAIATTVTIALTSMSDLMAQDAAGNAAAAPAAATPAPAGGSGEEAPAPGTGDVSFFDIIAGSGFIGILIWIMIFLTSAATLGLIIDASMTIRAAKIMPPELVNAVRSALDEGDLGGALSACETQPGPLANILLAGFNNVSEGFDVIMDSVSTAAEIESEKLMQRVNFLNLCGAIAPMLGLMGTVTGMVGAFSSLGTMSGSAKQAKLALDISQALYTTAVGLLIAVPAILAFTFVRNNASRIILDMESLTYDLIKVLRGAEVVDDEEEEYEEYE